MKIHGNSPLAAMILFAIAISTTMLLMILITYVARGQSLEAEPTPTPIFAPEPVIEFHNLYLAYVAG